MKEIFIKKNAECSPTNVRIILFYVTFTWTKQQHVRKKKNFNSLKFKKLFQKINSET
jgi:hypothetical protein